ncbi:hypothetical protein HUT18_01685 [Streptomyces sp. NA04227]|uniref:hypothetical protein n=1 Tax=Streptomyces sp. NA04227 TaxID=2742136 RepID=UPI0015903BAA|nr:hypothetical protein [Streptomyces sp. NA04227]QKW05269.1 hypothetical protein HUT18_01685 [Streptomyces sp. NA04227]
MWWGVAAALLANVLFSTGFVLEKRALGALPSVDVRRPAQLIRLVLGSPLWFAGALALAAGFGAQLLVYRTLPVAAAQGIFVSGLVLLLLLSSRLLGEETSGRERGAMAVILLALLMIVLSLGAGTDTIGDEASAPVILAIGVPSIALSLSLYAGAERRARRRHRLPTTGVPYGVALGILYGVSSLAIKGVSGHLTGFTDAPVAAAADLFGSPYPYLLLCTGPFGLVLSQAALQRCRASLIVPVCTTVTSVYTAVTGTLAFGESLPHEPVKLALRLGGTVLALSVLLALPKHDAPPQPTGHAHKELIPRET